MILFLLLLNILIVFRSFLRTCLKSKKACLKIKYMQKISKNNIILKRDDIIFTDFLDILIVFRQFLR